MPRNDLIQIRHGTQSEWATINPILASGEGGIDISSNIFKVGDGQSSWVDLHQIGGENLYYVKNDEGSVILAGQCVYAKGAVGNSNSIKAGLFIGNGTIPEYAVMGLAKTNIGIGEFGYVSAFGTISAIDTYPNGNITNLANANEYWEEGTILYASPITAGKLTSIKPAHDTILAIVLKRNNNGKLFVRPSWNPHLDDLHDVDTANYSDGKFLQYSLASGLWIPSSTGNFTSLFVNSVRVSVSGHTHSVSDISGLESLVPSNVVFTTGNQSISGIKVFNNLVQIGSPLNSDAGILNVYSNDGSDIASEINLKNNGGVNRLSITANDDTATSMIEASNAQLDLTNRDGAIRIFTKDNFTTNIPISGSGTYYQNFSVTDGKVQVGTSFRSGELSVIGSGNFSNSLLVGDSNGLLINNNSITTSSGNNIKIYTAPSGGLYVGPNYIDLNENPSPYNVQILAETSIGVTSMVRCLESGIGIGGSSYDITSDPIYISDSIDVVAGRFTSLEVNNVPVSVSGHAHNAIDIIDFNSSVSGLLPSISGTGLIETIFENNIYRIGVTGLQLTGDYVSLTGYEDISGTKTFLNDVVVSGQFSSVSGYFQDYLSLNGSGVSITGHSHIVSDITDFNSGVSGIIPVVTGTGSIEVKFDNNTYTINVTGLPLTGHRHPYTDIDNFCTGVADCVDTPLLAGTGIVLSFVSGTGLYIHFTGGSFSISNTGISAISGYFRDYLSLNGTGVSITGHTHQIYEITNLQSSLNNKQPTGVYVSLTGIESVTGIKTFINNIVATGGLSSTSGYFKDYLSLNGSGVSLTGHTHTISSITNFNSGVSGLLPTGTANYLSKFGNGGSGLSNSLFFDNGTNVGIGTASPASNFHISAALNANYGNILVSGTNVSTHIGLGGASDTVPFLSSLSAGNIATSVYGFGMFYRNTEGDFALSRKGGSTSWIRCLNIQRSNGNVGIGSGVQATTVPERLTVDGNIRVADTSVTQGNIVQFNRGGGGQYDYSIGKYNPALAISLSNDSSSQRPLQVGFHSGTTFLPRFHVNGYTGAVGINTTTPSGYLDVAGDVFIRGNPGTAGRINFKSSTFADTLLNIRSDTGGNIYMDAGGAAIKCGSQDGQIDVRGYSTNVQIGHTYNAGTIAQHVRFTPGGRELMRMTNSGTMGIGLPLTSNLFNIQPFDNCRLHIMGSGTDSSSSALNVANSGNSSLLFVRNDGNIGIRTNTPTSQLHIIGSGIFTSGLNVIGLLTSNSGNFTDSLQINGTGVWHSGNFDNTNIVRTTGTQIISGEKDFGGNLKISATNTTSADFFPTFGSNDPSSTSRTLQYITKQNLVNALSFEQVDLGNSFVNTTGSQQVSGLKTFLSPVAINANFTQIINRNNRLTPFGNIALNNLDANFITFHDAGSGLCPTNSTSFSSGLKILLKPMPSLLGTLPPVAIGLSNNSLWNVVPASNWQYEWNAASGNLATLSGNGMLSVFSGIFTRNGIFTNGIISGSGNFTNSLQVNGTGVSLTNHSHSSFSSLTLGGSSVPLNNFLNIDVPSGFSLSEYQDTNVFSINSIEDASLVFAVDGKGKITYGSIDAANINNFNDTVTSLLPTIANSGNNRILTSTGSSVGVNAEEGLTFDGSSLTIINGSIRHTVNAQDISDNIAPITWYNTFNDVNSVIAKIDVSTDSSPIEGMLVFHTNDGSSLQERLRITDVGNVGIGTTSPTSRLQVIGLITSSSGNFTDSLQINGTGVWHGGNFDNNNIVRTTGTQTVNGSKTFGNQTSFTSGIVTENISSNTDLILNSIDLIELNLSNGAEGGSIGVVYDVANKNQQFQLYDAASENAILVVTDRTSIVCPNTESSGTYFPVFIQNPNAGTSAILSRTASQLKGDIGLANVSVSGHSHSSSDITNFNSSVSGLLPTGTANYLSKFGTAGSGLSNSLVFDNGTNVGIGTASPSYQLDVAGDAEFGSNNWLKLIDTGSNNGRLVFSNIGSIDSAGAFLFRNNAGTTEHMRITTGGNVGIGTTAPSARLEVGGDVNVGYSNENINRTITVHSSNVSNKAGKIRHDGSSFIIDYSIANQGFSLGTSANRWINGIAYYGGSHLFYGNNGSNTILTINSSTSGVSIGSGYNVSTPTNGLIVQGNVGIGTSNPLAKLEVAGTGLFNGLNISNQTADTIVGFDGTKNLVSLPTGTYPSLTELSYVKGLTSAVQTQINSKQNTLIDPVIGTGISNHIAYWTSSSGIAAHSGQLYWDSINHRLGIGTEAPISTLQVSGLITSDSGTFGNLLLSSNTLSSITGNIVINPSTSGSLQRDAGGNTRGIYAVDWQTVRSTGTMVAAGTHSVICGGNNNSTVGSRSVVCGGNNNSAVGIASSIGGGNTNTTWGVRSTIGGGTLNTTYTENATIGGGSNNTANGLTATIGGGNLNAASGDGSTIAGGSNNSSFGGGSIVGGGNSNSANGYRSSIIGGSNNTTSTKLSSIIGGDGGKTTKSYEVAHSAGAFANAGDAQHTILIAKQTTTTNTAINLFIDTAERLTIPAKTTWTFDIKLSAYNDTDNLGAGWNIRGCLRRNNNNSTVLIGTNVVNQWSEAAMTGTIATALAGDANEALQIQVNGLSGKNIRWVAVVDISQVSYGPI